MKKKIVTLLYLLPLLLSSCHYGNVSSNREDTSVSTPSWSVSSTSVESSLSSQEENVSSSSDEDPTWPVDKTLYGSAFKSKLATLINATGNKAVTYSSLANILRYSDSLNNDGVHIIPFYHGEEDAREGEFQGKSQTNVVFNKEHVWPNSRGAGTTGMGSDPQMIRPALISENASRGNNFYASSGSKTFDPAAEGYFPARGQAARILFYCASKYSGFSLSNNPNDSTSLHTMGTLKTLLEWNKTYPVTESEISRNNYLDKEGFSRNPFIDHPEFADYIWDSNGLRKTAYTDVDLSA